MELLSMRELFWLFCIYSFLGWVAETGVAAIKHRKFVNRGVINGPFCVIYGFTAVLLTITLSELSGFSLFLFSMIYATVVEFTAGHLIEKIWKESWWDYSDRKYNLGGYICLRMSVIWGVLGYLAVRFGNELLHNLYSLLPGWMCTVILWIVGIALFIDVLADIVLLNTKEDTEKYERWKNANAYFTRLSGTIGSWVSGQIRKRMAAAYPAAGKRAVVKAETDETIFAHGCSFYKIVLLFFIGAFLGDITETIFCRITAGVWMSRSSVVWGPFSIVWGLAIAAVTVLLYKYKDYSDRFLFLAGTFLGGAYEYLCSVFTELVFGKVFWDYSKIPFNIAGRINLLYCFFWGIAAVVWFKHLYPVCSDMIEKIPKTVGKIGTWILVVFMIANIGVSVLALVRYEERDNGIPAEHATDEWLDTHYGDEKMRQIYPNAIDADAGGAQEEVS